MLKLDLKNMAIDERVKRLNTMIEERQILQAFEKFYAEDVTLQDNENDPLIGKDICRKKQEEFVTGILDYKKAKARNTLISNNISVVEWDMDYTHEEWGHRSLKMITVQRWNTEGEIINEKYYYNR
ncbi:SnoaL-like domain-containing protein [Carboxylicivirga linearis]|uniref:SnoaL-like domain-containing protein n=1 Tax=Carboxylicivirga linearis TaxID=1628157 RepID=A0ABS5JSM8_9BACT|nr:SnoaL-like domain-containing protein [Carboxylicivirga linearis]MBS2097554.1 hypothetical protein [Carboxylicivirga linearis]